MDVCEEKYPDILHFVDDLAHLDKASRGLWFDLELYMSFFWSSVVRENNALYLHILSLLLKWFHMKYGGLKRHYGL